jgi:hypothetical protein
MGRERLRRAGGRSGQAVTERHSKQVIVRALCFGGAPPCRNKTSWLPAIWRSTPRSRRLPN